MALSLYAQQLGSFFVLVCVQSTAILLFKLCQVGGTYTFSPASSVALTELCKLALAAGMHSRNVAASGERWFEGVSLRIVLHYFGLSLLYTINNQLSFYALEVADPGSMSLGKSVAPYLCAVLLSFSGQRVVALQWVCIIVQCCAIAIVQYDACAETGVLAPRAYMLIGLATSITAVTSVWNQLVIKSFTVPINLQNAIMYSFGSAIALFFYSRERRSRHRLGFFGGYNELGIGLILFQAFHGLAVALVYKYADAIVKNFANSAVMAILVVISAYFFELATTAHSWLGIVIVLTTTYCYMNIALKQQQPKPTGTVEAARLLSDESTADSGAASPELRGAAKAKHVAVDQA